MRPYRFFWETHKWIGIGASLLVLLISVTGFLLLIKKDHAWIQPPTQKEIAVADGGGYISMDRLYEILFALGRPDLVSEKDIARIDFRPKQKVFKVHLKQDHQEIQVAAISGRVLSQEKRWSDFIEELHDGSFFGGWAHGWLMPAFSVCLLFLMLSGLYLWLSPLLKKAAKRRATRSPARR